MKMYYNDLPPQLGLDNKAINHFFLFDTFPTIRPEHANMSKHPGIFQLFQPKHVAPKHDNLTEIVNNTTCLPPEMTFNSSNLMSVVVYGILFVVAAGGNLAVFCALFKSRSRRCRVNLFIMHLSLADLIVAFVVMPLEIGWHVTVSWNAGDLLCRTLMFFRAFGFYLSSFILVTISVDRYLVFSRTVSLTRANRRGKFMLAAAWILSAVASVPQSIIFHIESHPQFLWFEQCVTFNFFPNSYHELAYNLFNMAAVYALPLVIILVSYSLILCQMHRNANNYQESNPALCRTGAIRRRLFDTGASDISNRIEQARTRTLKMTVVIVSVFIICWTPYFVISAWWWFDQASADKIHPKVQKGLFLFAVSNSCMNPIIYGMFSTVFRRTIRSKCHHKIVGNCCIRREKRCPRCGKWY